jgi:hypothetical protein
MKMEAEFGLAKGQKWTKRKTLTIKNHRATVRHEPTRKSLPSMTNPAASAAGGVAKKNKCGTHPSEQLRWVPYQTSLKGV